MNVVVRTLAASAAGLLLVAPATAQDFGWEQAAARETKRSRELQRAQRLRDQYERLRAAAHARMRSEGESTLYASTPSRADTQLSCPVDPVPHTPGVLGSLFSERADGTLLISIGDGRSTVGGRQDSSLAPPYWPQTLGPVVPLQNPSFDFAATHAHLLNHDDRNGASSMVAAAPYGIPFFPSASEAHGRQGIAQVVNRSAQPGEVHIVAIDDTGRRYGPLALFVGANGTVRIDSDDLENGNADKGLFGGTGPGVGDWRLELSSELDIEALSYVRSWDGVVSAMHDVVPIAGSSHRVPIFNPASDWDRESRLRLTNPGVDPAEVSIAGIDSHGNSPGTGVSVTIPPGASLTYTAAELESGREAGLLGSLGDGTGEWQLLVRSEQPLTVMNLLASPTGHLTNLSTAPLSKSQRVHDVPLFPAASDPSGNRGLVRVINRSGTAGNVQIQAFDNTRWDYDPLILPIGPGEAVQFDSNDLEQGNAARGLAGGTGAGQGDWRLELTSDLDIEVLSYVRAWDGLLTSMHDVVPSEAEGTRHRVSMFGPERNRDGENQLRLINPGSVPAQVVITGVDAVGQPLGDGVTVTFAAGASRTYTAAELAVGVGAGLEGSLGTTTNDWQLSVVSEQPIRVMSLFASPTGHLTNLSTAPVRALATAPLLPTTDATDPSAEETPEDVFESKVSPIVQAQCILCHMKGRAADEPLSRLQFSPSTVEGHVALNLAVFEALIAALEEDEEVEDPAAYILTKVQGVDHGGRVQLTSGTDNYASLERFLGLLGEAVAPVGITPETLFEGVTMESARSTLRRAAIVFAGRIPTDAEYATIEGASEEEDGSEEALRTAIRGLMTGPGFHEFLIRASNDRLLTDRDDIQGVGVIDPIFGYFVDYNNLNHEKLVSGDPSHSQWRTEVDYGIRRAPLELIAHVVENDLPYTEVLTADYIMANPMAAEAYGYIANFDDPTDVHEFRPSQILSYYRTDDSKQWEYVPESGTHVSDPGNLATDYPHAGILNTTVFLKRYPTTATNRNRARSRWTYYHFLGLDVEKSASRTTDPVALADRNNPTMNNPACKVCHTVLDPVAGAFQNYDDVGYYRSGFGGMDSLDDLYKNAGPAGAKEFEITAVSEEESQVISVLAHLQTGSNIFGFENVNQSEICCTNILIDSIVIRNDAGDLVAQYEMEHLADWDETECGSRWGDLGVDVYCRVVVSTEAPTTADYQVDVSAWIGYQSDEAQGNAGRLRMWAPMPDDFYHEGDAWYRDMREPGFDGNFVSDAAVSLPWLAAQMVADPRFAKSTVEFWWPAIMGSEVAEPPEEGDIDFDGRLLASNAQAAEVERLAAGFRAGFASGEPYNLKDLLTEIILSPWFRASTMADDDPVRAEALLRAGAKRLLTPEELARKTLAITGFNWLRHSPSYPWWGDIIERTDWTTRNSYGLLYGGIDSGGIAERARDITTIMGGVANRHGAAVACPVVLKDFFLVPDGERQLFNGANLSVSPAYEFGAVIDVKSESADDKQTLSIQGPLQKGQATAVVSLANELMDEDTGNHVRQLFLDRIVLRDDNGNAIQTREFETSDEYCAAYRDGSGSALVFWDFCPVRVPFDIPSAGSYGFEVTAWAERTAGNEFVKLEIVVEGDPKTTASGRAIKSKVAELYDRFLGVSADADSPEVEAAYDLFVEVWELYSDSSEASFNQRCDWRDDQYYLDGIVEDSWLEPAEGEQWDSSRHGWNDERLENFFVTIDLSDPYHVAKSWTVMLAYLLTDYRYLFL